MRVALLQLNPTVGDLAGNARRIALAVRQAAANGADLAVTPELALMGYPPRDLLINRTFVERAGQVLHELAQALSDASPVLVGLATPNSAPIGRPLFNTAAFLQGGAVRDYFHKCLLPTYDVFDEDRYFEPAIEARVLRLNDWNLGVTICEDIWNNGEEGIGRRYHTDPLEQLSRTGVSVVINLSASPFCVGKQQLREALLSNTARMRQVPVLYVNQVGGNDDLVFDGRSCAFDSHGHLLARGRRFTEDCILVDLYPADGPVADDDFLVEAETWEALVLGTRDYTRKCGFTQALLGLSGGIDSSLTAAIAVEALGAENVLGVLMPSPYSSRGSVVHAQQLAANLGIRTQVLPINTLMIGFESTLEKAFRGYPRDATEENIQARIRGNLLMALSNKYGALLLTTGNKSELAVGYCTIYGDMSGGLAVISDLPKTMVYRLARWRNVTAGREVIPPAVLTKPPSAELRPDQTDQQTLPPYETLDEILRQHIECHRSASEIVAMGFEKMTVHRVLGMVEKAEFKRKQAAPGLKVTDRAFGVGWRWPIARKAWEESMEVSPTTAPPALSGIF
ncbi:MAG: NAD+ synthase [Acidobacteria bacterium]|nr:NAD+ synthase [Acidobacteriota bacterium]MBI3658246.1 NAD+ synthase [Acidobacteriota bacterium]